MADLPTYSFLPWARQGLAVRISETDTLGASNGATLERAQLIARLDLKHKNVDDVENISSITKTLTMVGPGDVTGFKSAAIIRTQPRNGITNFEANGMAYIEFYEEDFLWRYTPAAPANTGATTKLRPWLALVALKDDEYNIVANPSGLAYISIKQDAFNGAFHHQNDHWAFGHVHFNHKLAHTQNGQLKAEINTELKGNPDVALSRLLCPRKLQKNTSYHCFLIPAFETGRLNGLGIETTGIAAQTPSWEKGAMPASSKRPFDFPVFHQWWFRTGNYGDFESLATILKPIIIDKEQGKMPMDIQDPGFNLQAKNEGSKVIGLEAALKPVDMKKDKWPTNGTDNVEDITTVDELKKLLSLSADFVDPAAIISSGQVFFSAKITEDPILVPPIYGVWHALVDKLDKPATPKWVKELNLDFRNRAVAGAGATIIQQKQEDLMNRAWQQVDRVNEANKKIQMAELAKLIAGAIMKKSMINAGGDKSYLITNSVQHLILNQAKTQTIQQDFIDSRIPVAAKTAAFRKLTRPANKTATANKVMAAAVSKPLLVNITTIIDQFNKAESDVQAVRGARLKEAPIGALSLTAIGTAISKAVTDYEGDPKNIAVNNFVEIIKTHVLNANASLTKVQLQQEGNAVAGLSAAAKQLLTDFISNIATEPVKATAGHVTVLINHAFFSGQFTDGISSKIIDNIILKDNTAPAVTAANTMASLDDLKNIQSSFATFNTNVMALPLQKELPAFSNIATTAKTLFSRLSPEVTFASKLASSIRIWKNGVYVPLRKLKPIMAHPEFTEAVYNYFLAISKNYILPNIDKIPNNSITLLQNNQSFIESAMAGLNHEMARELLWREYPTDQRGSYFRQFWNISDTITVTSVDAEKEKEQKLDIKKMHEWDNALGGNCPRPNSDNIVLIIRGDLLKKYSNTVVYAQRAEYAADPTLPRKLKGDIDGTEIKFPLFKADIDPDITLFGFDLQPKEAAGERIENTSTPIAGKNPGWFFVLKERPGQVNFGMDDFTDEHGNTELMPPAGTKPKDWNDLAWEYLINSKAELNDYHLNFSKTITITDNVNQAVWGSNAADMAAILLQDPALIARHAAEMLPEDF